MVLGTQHAQEKIMLAHQDKACAGGHIYSSPGVDWEAD
jgi:hypothetical protein